VTAFESVLKLVVDEAGDIVDALANHFGPFLDHQCSYSAVTLRLPVDSRLRPAFLGISKANPKLNRSKRRHLLIHNIHQGKKPQIFLQARHALSRLMAASLSKNPIA
jgi:hypothetical protein